MHFKKYVIIIIVLSVLSILGFGLFRFYHCTLQGRCPIKVTEEADGIRLTLKSSERLYEKNETHRILIVIKNQRSEEAHLFSPNDQPAIEVTYRTKSGNFLWHEEHPNIAYNSMILASGEKFTLEITIPPKEQPVHESGKLCTYIRVNYPGGQGGGYGFGTCITYNNRGY